MNKEVTKQKRAESRKGNLELAGIWRFRQIDLSLAEIASVFLQEHAARGFNTLGIDPTIFVHQ